MTLKVLITDSSEEACKALESIINTQANMQVVGIANDSFQARKLIKTLKPDVLTLSIELPRMNGLDFLDKIMKLNPMPVVVISKLVEKKSLIAEQALKIGATACVSKPKLKSIDYIASDIITSVREAVSLFKKNMVNPKTTVAKSKTPVIKPKPPGVKESKETNNITAERTKHLIAIGASTGGTEAITALLTKMPTDCPGIVIAQHMPKGFTASFAGRLGKLCSIQVSEAKHDQLIKPGNAYIAPGGAHLLVQKRSGCYYTILSDSKPVNVHKPSIDILFESVAENIKHFAVGVILTGMGKDGALGLLKMKESGAKTFSQDEATSVVYGMPRAAKKVGAVNHELPLGEITAAVLNHIKIKNGLRPKESPNDAAT